MNNPAAWWQTAVIYQVLVRSFQDSNDDGQGDLPGLISRLDYIAELGADALWLSPIYDSPWAESGYDVSNYEQVHPVYGTLADFDRLLAEAHQRGIRVLLDWVPNHTSDRHPWFREACQSRNSPRRDWYQWADPKPDGSPPNNWLGVFGGSAWTLHEPTGQYYFHAFLPQQADLNLRNPAVREALCGNLRYWCRLGVDGFRIDAADMLVEDESLTDNPPNPDSHPGDAPDNLVVQKYTRDQPGNHAALAEMRRTIDEFPDHVLVGESYLLLDRLVTYYGTTDRPELHLPLNLRLPWTPWEADPIQALIDEYNRLMPKHGWPCWSLGNHDIKRLASRVPPGQERVAAMLLLTLRGTPTMYYGDEIGMRNVDIPRILSVDPQTQSWPGHSRDPARTPMQWDSSEQAGFTHSRPWLPVGEGRKCNVADQQRDPHSLWSLYRDLIALRRRQPALRLGEQRSLPRKAPVVAFQRRDQASGQRLIVALNVSDAAAELSIGTTARVIFSTQPSRPREIVQEQFALAGHEGAICELL